MAGKGADISCVNKYGLRPRQCFEAGLKPALQPRAPNHNFSNVAPEVCYYTRPLLPVSYVLSEWGE